MIRIVAHQDTEGKAKKKHMRYTKITKIESDQQASLGADLYDSRRSIDPHPYHLYNVHQHRLPRADYRHRRLPRADYRHRRLSTAYVHGHRRPRSIRSACQTLLQRLFVPIALFSSLCCRTIAGWTTSILSLSAATQYLKWSGVLVYQSVASCMWKKGRRKLDGMLYDYAQIQNNIG